MSTLKYTSKEQQADTQELELGLEIPVLEASGNELKNLRSAYEAASAIRDELQAKLKNAVEYSNKQAKVIDDIKDTPSEVAKLKALLGKVTERNNILSNNLEEREIEIQYLNDEITFLRESVSDLQPLKKQLDHANEDNRVLSKQLQERDTEVENLNGKYSVLRSKIIDIRELREQLKQADGENQLLSRAIEDQRIHLTTRIEELDSQIASFSSIRKEFNSRGAELKTLQDALDHSDNKIYQLTSEIEQHTKRENFLNQKIEQDKKSIELHVIKIQAQELQLAELEELRANLMVREKQTTELNQAIETECKRIRLLETEMSEAHIVVNSLQTKVESANQAIPTLERNIRLRDDKISTLEKELVAREEQLESLTTSVGLRDSKITSLENVLMQAKEQISPLRSELSTQETRIRELEKLFQEAKEIVSISSKEETK